MNSKYLFIFAISVFFLLSISGAGIFINDEWIVGQQLNQLSEGHQLFYNEGKYGYFVNGTASNYMILRNNILIYSLALPIISLPIHLLFTLLSTTFTRFAIISFWGLCGLYIIKYLTNINIFSQKGGNILKYIFFFIISCNIIIANNFIMEGKFIPYEMLAIVFTNILLFGIFSVICYIICESIFENNIKQLVCWISCISLTSVILWSTTLKDHMLITTIVILICLIQIKIIYNNAKWWYNFTKYIFVGLTIWVRPEIGLPIIIGVILFDIYYFKQNIYEFISMIYWISIGTIPLFLNNLIVTGNPLSHPFLLTSKSNIVSGNMIAQVASGTTQIPFAQLVASSPQRWIELIFAPTSGALGLITPLILFLFAIFVYIKYRPTLQLHSKFLFLIGVLSISYYLLYAGAYLGADGGIIPDIRYFTAAYTPLTLFALTIIPYNDLNHRKMLKNIVIYTPVVIILSLFTISIYPPVGETFKSYRMIAHIISTFALSIMIILLVNDRNNKPNKWIERLIPLAIASAFSWQVIMIFVYHISKAHYYPMFIPATEIIYKLIFGV